MFEMWCLVHSKIQGTTFGGPKEIGDTLIVLGNRIYLEHVGVSLQHVGSS